MAETLFSILSDDIVLNILSKLQDDPRHLSRLACVSTRFSSLIRHFCWKSTCTRSFPSLLSDLTSTTSPSSIYSSLHKLSVCCPGLLHSGVLSDPERVIHSPHWKSHLASGNWNLSREQGSKLLARQFRDDCLYICDWPGCVHFEERRKYSLFRGMFKDFKGTRVWRTINEGNHRRRCMMIGMGCAFCGCDEIWDLNSAFCLRRGFGFHHDGEPVVRAYVCDNGHVSGAWTDVPMYS